MRARYKMKACHGGPSSRKHRQNFPLHDELSTQYGTRTTWTEQHVRGSHGRVSHSSPNLTLFIFNRSEHTSRMPLPLFAPCAHRSKPRATILTIPPSRGARHFPCYRAFSSPSPRSSTLWPSLSLTDIRVSRPLRHFLRCPTHFFAEPPMEVSAAFPAVFEHRLHPGLVLLVHGNTRIKHYSVLIFMESPTRSGLVSPAMRASSSVALKSNAVHLGPRLCALSRPLCMCTLYLGGWRRLHVQVFFWTYSGYRQYFRETGLARGELACVGSRMNHTVTGPPAYFWHGSRR